MTVPQAEEWAAYADTINIVDPITGKTYHPSAINAFMQLGVKFLQLNPSGTLPAAPPTSDFEGDTVFVTASSEGPGVITFEAGSANAAGVSTEMLIQRLDSPHRKPDPNGYRHAAFKSFQGLDLTQNVNVTPGWYAAAYRFVKNSTGQATNLFTIPILQVSLTGMETPKPAARKLQKAA